MTTKDTTMPTIDNLTLSAAKAILANAAEVAAAFGWPSPAGSPAPAGDATADERQPIGEIVCIETILGHYVGLLESVTSRVYWLRDAAWISQTGRYHQWAAGAEPGEVEPLPDGLISVERTAVILVRRHPRLFRTAI